MKLGLLTAAFPDLTLEEVAACAASERFETREIACWPAAGRDGRLCGGVTHLVDAFDPDEVHALLARHRLSISALDLGTPPELFYAVRRLEFEEEVEEATDRRFHVLCLVAGKEVVGESSSAAHPLLFAETLVIPAAVGRYRIRRVRGGACKLVKAFVR